MPWVVFFVHVFYILLKHLLF